MWRSRYSGHHLSPLIGEDRAAQIAKQAYAEGRSVQEIAAATTNLSTAGLERRLNPRFMINGGLPDTASS